MAPRWGRRLLEHGRPVSTDPLDDLSSLVGQEMSLDERRLALERGLRWRSVRMLLGASALIGGLVTLLLASTIRTGEPWGGLLPPLLAALVCGVGAVFYLRLPRERAKPGVMLLMSLVMMMGLALAWSRGAGLGSPGLGVLALMVALGTALTGLTAGLWLFGVGALCLLLMAWLEAHQMLPPVDAGASVPAQLVTQLVLLGTGLVVGLGTLRLVRRSMREASERNARFRHLLSMAADWYWEMDRDFRFTHMAENIPGQSGLDLNQRIGKTPWEIDQFGISDEDMDAHRADIDALHGSVQSYLARNGRRFVGLGKLFSFMRM